MNDVLKAAVEKASNGWKEAFNAGNAEGCASFYETDATMTAQPFGTFTGREAIQAFWQQIIDGGYADVCYSDIECVQVDDQSVRLSASWTMNKAGGVITNELWVLQADGSMQLRIDEFEARS
ncbi:YybH family protein [Coralliovum pocilloporae]|uniref:YybH family protein n=1 Tax=Coralliovum pocilloporae TaxID=3066369 RepID=UPI0033074B12